MNCLFCQERLPLLKRLKGLNYCSEEHEQKDREELGRAAVVALSLTAAAKRSDAAGIPSQMAEAG